MWTPIIFTLSYFLLFSLSAYYYKNDPRYYATSKIGKSDGTLKGYSLVNLYLRISTLAVALWSVFSENKYLFLIHHSSVVAYIGLGFSWIGIYLFIRSRTDLGENYSPCYDAYLPNSITENGLYSLVRHPIYSSNIFLLIAIFIATGSLWIFINVLILSYFYNKSAHIEESELCRKYTDYKGYMNNTNRYIPSLRKLFKRQIKQSE